MSQSRLSFAPLLLHGDLVPPGARAALRSAYEAPEADRADLLHSAARVLARETELDCGDVRELVGLSADFSCG